MVVVAVSPDTAAAHGAGGRGTSSSSSGSAVLGAVPEPVCIVL